MRCGVRSKHEGVDIDVRVRRGAVHSDLVTISSSQFCANDIVFPDAHERSDISSFAKPFAHAVESANCMFKDGLLCFHQSLLVKFTASL